MEFLFILNGMVAGTGIGWLAAQSKVHTLKQAEQQRYHELNLEYTAFRASKLAELKSAAEKLEIQKAEMMALSKKFNIEFENIANRILETKSEKFTKTI